MAKTILQIAFLIPWDDQVQYLYLDENLQILHLSLQTTKNQITTERKQEAYPSISLIASMQTQ